ncbi:MAG TPA: phosphatase PAP2 family protein [Caulobacteraceae bacterium]
MEPAVEAAAPDANPVEKADIQAGVKLARWRDSRWVKAAAKAGDLGDQEPLYALTGAVLVFGLLRRDRRVAEAGARMLAAVAAADFAKSTIKSWVTRTRPHVLMDEQEYDSELGGGDEKPRQSFPSGHAAGGAAVARALSRLYPQAGLAAGAGAAAMGVTRVAKGAHYPLDVVAGAVVGLAAEAAVDLAFRTGRAALSSSRR